MKKTLLTAICASAVSAVSFGQGYVNWGAIVPTYISVQTNGNVSSPLSATLGGGATVQGSTSANVGNTVANTAGLTYYFELLYATSGTAAPTTLAGLGSWTATGLIGENNAAHNISPTSTVLPSSGSGNSSQVPWANGTSMEVIVAGWSANLGSTYALAWADVDNWTLALQTSIGSTAFFGLSNEGLFNPAATSPGSSPFGTAASGLINSPNMQLNQLVAPVPEPGTMALAALGGASLLLFRRKK